MSVYETVRAIEPGDIIEFSNGEQFKVVLRDDDGEPVRFRVAQVGSQATQEWRAHNIEYALEAGAAVRKSRWHDRDITPRSVEAGR